MFVLVAAIIVWAKFNSDGFNILWRYFAWSNQTLSLFAFLAISVWMFENKKSKFVWIPLIPAAWYTFICVTYIANAQIGFHIPWTPRLRHRRLRGCGLCGRGHLVRQEACRSSGQGLSGFPDPNKRAAPLKGGAALSLPVRRCLYNGAFLFFSFFLATLLGCINEFFTALSAILTKSL